MFTQIPPTYKILEILEKEQVESYFSKQQVVEAIRNVTNSIRESIKTRKVDLKEITEEAIIADVKKFLLKQKTLHLKPVINATGIILHTNLGRSPLAPGVIKAVTSMSEKYSNLELDLQSGERTERNCHVEGRLIKLTGAEAALVVNNDAAAVMIILNTFSKDKEVIVSRGELVEIGGSFRLPDIMRQSGAKLVEVGTTNRTYIKDYEKAITEETSLLFKAHTSNYAIVGFTASPTIEELVHLGRSKGIPVVEDMGNGLLIDLSVIDLPKEPRVQELVAAGVDLTAFSGDKLFGGPQAGIIVGRNIYIEQLKKNPLLRSLRVDKLHLAALESTLCYYEEDRWQELPIYRMLLMTTETVRKSAKHLASSLKTALKNSASIDIWESHSECGGGTLPSLAIPTWLVAISPNQITADALAKKVRIGNTPIIGRILKDSFTLDPRTINKEELSLIPPLIFQALS